MVPGTVMIMIILSVQRAFCVVLLLSMYMYCCRYCLKLTEGRFTPKVQKRGVKQCFGSGLDSIGSADPDYQSGSGTMEAKIGPPKNSKNLEI